MDIIKFVEFIIIILCVFGIRYVYRLYQELNTKIKTQDILIANLNTDLSTAMSDTQKLRIDINTWKTNFNNNVNSTITDFISTTTQSIVNINAAFEERATLLDNQLNTLQEELLATIQVDFGT